MQDRHRQFTEPSCDARPDPTSRSDSDLGSGLAKLKRRDGRMSLVPRGDGQQQWAFNGKPLYAYAEDEMHGDVKGDNVENLWHVVR